MPRGFRLGGNKYIIEGVLGQGGFGITYLAQNVNTRKNYAIKEFFPKEYCGRDESTMHVITHLDTDFIERFKRKFIKEAGIMMSFHHPNIVRVYECFEENKTAYYVMEYIEGESLSSYVNKRGALHEQDAREKIKKVAQALDYIHHRHINHLDVKPANILIRQKDNEVILIDFGTAKHYDSKTDGATTVTHAGYSRGYAPIEQYKLGGVSIFSPEADIYSLGATLYKMLMGHTPPEPSMMLESGLPQMPEHIPTNMSMAVQAAMQISRSNRPHSIKEFLDILDWNEPRKGFSIQGFYEDNPTAFWIIIAAIAVLAIEAFFFAFQSNEPEAPSTPMEFVDNSLRGSTSQSQENQSYIVNTERLDYQANLYALQVIDAYNSDDEEKLLRLSDEIDKWAETLTEAEQERAAQVMKDAIEEAFLLEQESSTQKETYYNGYDDNIYEAVDTVASYY